MIKFRKTPKKRPGCSFVGDCCYSKALITEDGNNKSSRLSVIYRYKDESFEEPAPTDFVLKEENEEADTDHCVNLTIDEDDWLLLGVLPGKELRRYNVEGDSFSLSYEDAELLENDIIHYAHEKLLNYLAYRERAVSECVGYLKNLPLNEGYIEKLIKNCIDKNYLNDLRFAELLTESSISKNKSRIEAKAALIKKRIAPDITEDVLARLYTRENIDNAVTYHLEKAFKRYPDRKSYKDYHKCIAYLLKKGFKYDDFVEKVKLHYEDRG